MCRGLLMALEDETRGKRGTAERSVCYRPFSTKTNSRTLLRNHNIGRLAIGGPPKCMSPNTRMHDRRSTKEAVQNTSGRLKTPRSPPGPLVSCRMNCEEFLCLCPHSRFLGLSRAEEFTNFVSSWRTLRHPPTSFFKGEHENDIHTHTLDPWRAVASTPVVQKHEKPVDPTGADLAQAYLLFAKGSDEQCVVVLQHDNLHLVSGPQQELTCIDGNRRTSSENSYLMRRYAFSSRLPKSRSRSIGGG